MEAPDGKKSHQMTRKTPPSFGFSKQTQCGVDPFEVTFGSIFFDEDPEEEVELPDPDKSTEEADENLLLQFTQ